MRQRTSIFLSFFLITLFLGISQQAISQILVLQTCKKVYVSGEEVNFKCTMVQPNQNQNNILFVDVCGEGYIISSQLLKQNNSHWSGQIMLPDTLETGIYLLRAYVGNNNGQPNLVSLPLTVFNRFGNHDVNESRKSKTGYHPLIQEGMPTLVQDDALKLNTDKNSYETLEEVHLTIVNKLDKAIGGLSVSVFKTTDEIFANNMGTESNPAFSPSENVKIYSKLNLSGKITNRETQKNVTNETVILSIPDTIPNIYYAYTNENGEFHFVLDNLYGQQDMIVQTLNKQTDYSIQLYPVLLLPPAQIPYFIPEEVENNEFSRLSIQRATLHKVYGKEKPVQEYKIPSNISFYGKTTHRVLPEIYVPLNDFEEIAWEILPTLKYRLDKDSTYLKIWDPQIKNYYFNPWILVDGVPIYNLGDLNVLNSEKIRWIEIQPQVRCYGDLLIEGLLNIQTKRGDFTEVPLPRNAVRTKMETFSSQVKQSMTDKPLFNDILFWDPNMEAEKDVQEIKFNCTYEKGTYVAIVQTADQSGKVHYSSIKFNVE